jgi:hypothetical protein
MNNTAKKTLLARKFTSVEYMSKYVKLYQQMVFNLKRGMDEFEITYKKNPKLDAHNFTDWINRGYPNLARGADNAIECLDRAKLGNISGISSSAGNLRGISRDVDNIGGFGEWWQHIDMKFKDDFNEALDLAQTTGSNIDWTIRGSWNDDEILDVEITGPIDETELLSYLKPNEKLEDIS